MFPTRSLRRIGILTPNSGAAAAILRARAAEWEVALSETPEALVMAVWGCELRLLPGPDETRIALIAPDARLIGTLQDSATELFESHGLTLRWDQTDAGALAPGLSLMRLSSVHRRSPGFLRIRLTGPDAPRFGRDGLHFRLLLAPPGRAPIWPRVGDTGRALWPEGADALHRPVYTVLDQQDDWLDFEIFHHAGSPTCAWAETARPGETVGIIGPGGGWCPDGARLWLFGDETALPAIARILALTPAPTRTVLCCAAHDLGPLSDDPRVSLAPDLIAALTSIDPAPEDFVWFAGPAHQARAARAHLTARGHPKRQFMAAAYWDQPDSPA